MLLDTILVPTDFSDNSKHAFEQAAELAVHMKAKLHLLHVVEPLARAYPEVSAELSPDSLTPLDEQVEKHEGEAHRALRLLVDSVNAKAVDVALEARRDLSAYQGITSAVEELTPDLLVLGTHGRTGVARLVMGSVAEKVLRHVPVDVLTVHETARIVRAENAFDRILVPVDFSEHSKRALLRASSLLRPGGSLVVAHVVASPIHPSFYAAGITRLFQLDPDLSGRIERHAEEWLGDLDVAEVVVREGDISRELNQIARDRGSQLVVMGRSGVSGLDRMLLGSVSETMARHAERPVLTVV